ncbi:hypothetical protein [Ciceribacter thiooxidans]|uniref:Uncharacterized protein n=1 Tax=Ciceribacter thiooxidans TaxID=1969821 RepID=A0ABV7IA91_9HYPH
MASRGCQSIGNWDYATLATQTDLAIRTLTFCATNAHITVRKGDIAGVHPSCISTSELRLSDFSTPISLRRVFQPDWPLLPCRHLPATQCNRDAAGAWRASIDKMPLSDPVEGNDGLAAVLPLNSWRGAHSHELTLLPASYATDARLRPWTCEDRW